MGQRCNVPAHGAYAASLCKTSPPGACVCRHSDFHAVRAHIDEQEDNLHPFMERDVDGNAAARSIKDTPTPVRNVENMEVPNGGVYTGQAREDGQPHGHGTQRWPDGTVYTGSWASGAAHGRGKLLKADGCGYDGQWMEGRKQGSGSEWLVDQSEYHGEFTDGQKHGQGSFRWQGGASYTGEFCEDALHGDGIFSWGDGRSYQGQWVQSRMHGQGRFTWPDGKGFEGRYENDKKHGPGVFTWPDRSKCVGVWLAGKQHGAGTHISSTGQPRRGRWKDGTLETWLDPVCKNEEGPPQAAESQTMNSETWQL